MHILGISAFYHDSAACLIEDGQIVAAAQEERFSRKKHDPGFPSKAVVFCLQSGGISVDQLDCVAYYEKPFLKFERLLETYLACAPNGLRSFSMALPIWMKKKLWIREVIRQNLEYQGKVLFSDHHESHAASAFFPSPFKQAAFLTIDAVGEWATTSFGIGNDNHLEIWADLHFPHSVGMLYSAFTYYLGFKVNSGEYKVMGLAPYGQPIYRQRILDELIDLKQDGSLKLNMRYFHFASGLTMTTAAFHRLFDGPPRVAETELTQRHMDVARSIQEVTEEIVLRMARHIRAETGQRHLCLAGGVALNCVTNGKLLREGIFDSIWIQPAAGDAGGALGAALVVWYQYYQQPRTVDIGNDQMRGSLLGPEFNDQEIEQFLDKGSIPYEKLSLAELPKHVAKLITQGQVIGWFQGRMEYGPRALGARSILADARSESMQATMNLKIKFRESFRPFAPAILADRVSDYFELDQPSPYMLFVAPVHAKQRLPVSERSERTAGFEQLKIKRSQIPAVTHVDYSARVQTVHRDTNPLFYELLSVLDRQYQIPVVINTSFNVRGEPIVCTPQDAYRCFMRTRIDYLVMGSFLLKKENQPKVDFDASWQKEFTLD